MEKEAGKAWFFLLPSLTGILIFELLPFLDVIRRSFYEAMGGKFVGFSNYKTVLRNKAFGLAVSNSIHFMVICIPILLIVSLLLALLLYQQKVHVNFFKTSFLIPMSIPVASIVLLWKLLFHVNGLLNALLASMGKAPIDFMNTNKAFLVLVFSYLWKNTGYDMILWLTGLNGINTSLYEAAGVDGAGAFQKFCYITFPMLSQSIFMIGILSFINSFKVFREAYLISGDYPEKGIYLLQHLFNNWFTSLDIQKMTAGAVLCIFIFIIVIILFKKLDWNIEDEI